MRFMGIIVQDVDKLLMPVVKARINTDSTYAASEISIVIIIC